MFSLPCVASCANLAAAALLKLDKVLGALSLRFSLAGWFRDSATYTIPKQVASSFLIFSVPAAAASRLLGHHSSSTFKHITKTCSGTDVKRNCVSLHHPFPIDSSARA